MLCCRRRQTHGVAPSGEVVDEWWTELLPGDYFGVEYVDDEVSHERLALRVEQGFVKPEVFVDAEELHVDTLCDVLSSDMHLQDQGCR